MTRRPFAPRHGALLAAALVGIATIRPSTADAQLLGRMKAQASERMKQTRSRADSAVMSTTGRVADSTLGKTDRVVTGAATAVGGAADTAMNRAGRAVGAAVHGIRGGQPDAAITAGLASGHLVLRDPAFAAGSADLPPAAGDAIRALAEALNATTGPFLVEGHAADAADPAANQALSERRAAAVKSALVAAGVPPTRLFATGYGATRAAADGGAPTRIELTRMQ